MNITYARHTASPSLTQGQLTSYLDDLLSSMRLELLLGLVKAPIFESRKHVPGDIFSRQLQDGYLQTLDEDRLVTFESTGLKADLDIMADFEARFLWHCASRETLHGYVQKHLHALTGRAIAPLIQTSLLKRLAKEMKTGYLLDSYTAIDLLQNFVQSWFHTLARTHRSFETHNSVWKWIVRLASGSIDIPGRESPNGTRLSVTHSGPTRIFYQWTPLASGGTAGFHEERMINALVLYTEACFNLSGNSRGPHIIENLARILDPWNVWIGLPFDLSVRGTRTVLFIYTGSLSTATFKICQGHPSDSRGGRYRLTCVKRPANGLVSHKMLFSVNIDPSIELWDGPELIMREGARALQEMAIWEDGKLDVLVDAVRQSMELDEDQKDCMIEGIRAFPTI